MVIIKFISILMIAIFIENALFMRALGTRRMIVMINKSYKLMNFAYFLVPITLVSTGLVWGVSSVFNHYSFYYLITPLICIICMSFTYLIIYAVCKKFFVSFLRQNLELIISATFNTVVFGTLLLNFSHQFGFIESLVFGLGSQIGFILAIIMVIEGNKRLNFCSVPTSLKGLPIILIYMGILSLAFYGFVGHLLPS